MTQGLGRWGWVVGWRPWDKFSGSSVLSGDDDARDQGPVPVAAPFAGLRQQHSGPHS